MNAKLEQTAAEIGKVFVGNRPVVHKMILAMLAGGHVLLEDMPGVGKTTLALAFSCAMGLEYNRMQFTPDVMPSDITGFSVYNSATKSMAYHAGAALCNLFLADELNRAPSRTQAALLEAMEEGQVTVDGVTHPLPHPFMVIATQNPSGSAGTQLLPESQLDRFMMRLSIGYPNTDGEAEILRRKHGETKDAKITQIINADEVLFMREQAARVYIADEIYEYIVALVRATRTHASIKQGASPRGSVVLMALAQAAAFLMGRDYVLPADVQALYIDCIAHRLLLQSGPAGQNDAEAVLREILKSTPAPSVAKTR